MSLPPLPAWNALHVLIVHFPIALLLLATPVLILLAVAYPKAGRQFVWAAAVILTIGTACLLLAVNTGEAAEQLALAQGVEDDPVIHDALETHAGLAERARNIYMVLGLAFLIYLALPVVLRRPLRPALNAAVLAIFLAAYMGAGLVLVNTAHAGGLLVHEHGLTAPLGDAAAAAAAAGSTEAEDEDTE